MKQNFRVTREQGIAEYALPPSMCREIGRIVVRWAYLESTAQSLVRRVLQIGEPQGRIALREPRLSDRLTMLRDLIALIDGKWDDELFKSVLKRSNDLKISRDLVAHSIWAKRNGAWYVERARGAWEGEFIGLVEAKNRIVVPQLVPMGLAKLKETSAAINDLIADVRRLRDTASGPS